LASTSRLHPISLPLRRLHPILSRRNTTSRPKPCGPTADPPPTTSALRRATSLSSWQRKTPTGGEASFSTANNRAAYFLAITSRWFRPHHHHHHHPRTISHPRSNISVTRRMHHIPLGHHPTNHPHTVKCRSMLITKHPRRPLLHPYNTLRVPLPPTLSSRNPRKTCFKGGSDKRWPGALALEPALPWLPMSSTRSSEIIIRVIRYFSYARRIYFPFLSISMFLFFF